MGVDSGLPDFRGDQGLLAAYPAYQKLGLPASRRWLTRAGFRDPSWPGASMVTA